MKKFTFYFKTRVNPGKETEEVCKALEDRFPDHTFHAIKKREISDEHKPNLHYGP